MFYYLHLFYDLCYFRKSPADVPCSPTLLGLLSVFYGILGWFQFSGKYSVDKALLISALMLIVMGVFTYFILWLRGFHSRWVQTMVALIGVNILINVFLYILLLISFLVFKYFSSSVILVVLALLAIISLNIWLLLITAHIYRFALEVNFLKGLLITCALLGINILLLINFFQT